MQIVKLSRRGNSRGIVVPKPCLDQLQWGLGDQLLLEVTPDQLRVQLLTTVDLKRYRPKPDAEPERHAEAQA